MQDGHVLIVMHTRTHTLTLTLTQSHSHSVVMAPKAGEDLFERPFPEIYYFHMVLIHSTTATSIKTRHACVCACVCVFDVPSAFTSKVSNKSSSSINILFSLLFPHDRRLHPCPPETGRVTTASLIAYPISLCFCLAGVRRRCVGVQSGAVCGL